MAARYRLTAGSWRDLAGVRHKRGDVVELSEVDAARLLRARAVEVFESDDDASDAAEADRLAAEKAEADRVAAEQKAEADRLAAEQEARAATVPAPTAKVPPRPKLAAPKSAWEAYALARGIDTVRLDKDEIIEAVDALDKK